MKTYRKGNSSDSLEDLGRLLEKSGTTSGSGNGPAPAGKKPVRSQASAKPAVLSGIRAGQRVVLMDSNLYGTVLRAGVKAIVRLEDGMEIETDYSEIAAADIEEENILRKSHVGVRGQGSSVSRPRSFTGNLTVDLHISSIPGGRGVPEGRQLEFQMEVFHRILNENLRHRGMRISFIHGMGEGILRRMIQKELEEVYSMRCTYTSGPGITVVTVR